MHASFHTVLIPVQHSDRFLLFHTLRGAADLIPGEVAAALEPTAAVSTESLTPQEIETLSGRGHLTDRPVEQEQEQARAVLRLAANNSRRPIDFVLRFPADNPSARMDPETIREIFSLAEQVADGEMITIRLEVATPKIDAETIDHILSLASRLDYPILPTINLAGMDALQPWLRSENFQIAVLETDSFDLPVDVEAISNRVINYFERQVHVSWRCIVDGMSPEQLEAVHQIRERVRLAYPSFMVSLVSKECEGTVEPTWHPASGFRVPYISSENELLMNTLFRFITSPKQINYSPFFQSEPVRIVFTAGADEPVYDSPESGSTVKGFDEVRARIEDESLKGPVDFMSMERQGAECLSCKHALVCGREWIGKYGYKDSGECAESLELRMKQVMPLLLYNLRGNVRPPGSTGKRR